MNAENGRDFKLITLMADLAVVGTILYFYVTLSPVSVPKSIQSHTLGAFVVLAVVYSFYFMLIPPVVMNRLVRYSQIIYRNLRIVLFSVVTFSVLVHAMSSKQNSNEVNFCALFAACTFVGVMVVRVAQLQLLRLLRQSGRNNRSVLFVGSDPALLHIYDSVMSDPTCGYTLLGYYDDEEIEGAPMGLKRLGTKADLADILLGKVKASFQVDEMYCSIPSQDLEYMHDLMNYCDAKVIHFYYVPRIARNIRLSLKPLQVGDSIVYTSHYNGLASLSHRIVKRAFDIFFSLLALICTLPLLPIIAYKIKSQSPGPLIFKQKRTGLDGKDFMCYKFRSMHVNADADKKQATQDDPRKFAFGNFLRKSNLDELPQFYNVLRGDMSIVGPRPHMTLHTQMYSELIQKYMVRCFAKPGVTGLAQVTGFRGETKELAQMEGRIRRDIWYIENWSLWLDIKICFMTIKSIFINDEHAY